MLTVHRSVSCCKKGVCHVSASVPMCAGSTSDSSCRTAGLPDYPNTDVVALCAVADGHLDQAEGKGAQPSIFESCSGPVACQLTASTWRRVVFHHHLDEALCSRWFSTACRASPEPGGSGCSCGESGAEPAPKPRSAACKHARRRPIDGVGRGAAAHHCRAAGNAILHQGQTASLRCGLRMLLLRWRINRTAASRRRAQSTNSC